MRPSSQRPRPKGRAGLKLAALGAAALLSGCKVDPADFDRSRAEGELARGDFIYGCVSPADAACEYRCTVFTCEASSTNERASIFPPRVAVGALFSLSYEYEGGASSSRFVVAPADPSWVDSPVGAPAREGPQTFAARRPGSLAFLARNQAGRTADLLHVEFAPLHHLEVNDFGATTATLSLDPGDSIDLQAYPQGADGQLLGGALPYAWATSNAAVVSMAQGVASDRARVEALSSGEATVRVTSLDATREIVISVRGQ